MISKKNFFTITVMMAVVFFLFMVTGGAKLVLSNYEQNEYSPLDVKVTDTKDIQANLTDDSILYLGDSEKIYTHLCEWGTYTKRGVTKVDHGSGFLYARDTLSMVVVDGASLQEEDISFLLSAEESKVTTVFASVPSVDFLNQHAEVANLMGIRAIQSESTTLAGMHLYEGFLLGGEKIYELGEKDPKYYQDLDLTVPWYILESASKVYMSGYLNKSYKDVDEAYTPPIIWRYNTKNAYTYVVNSDFMEDISALGIYTAVLSDLEEISVYPVINSQNLVFYNYPTFANENNKQVKELYSRDTVNFLETLVWPTTVAVSSSNKLTPSFMMSAKLNYNSEAQPLAKALNFLMELIRENHGEAGLSMDSYSQTDEKEKLSYDLDFFKEELAEYQFYSCYIGDVSMDEAEEVLSACGAGDISTLLADRDGNQNLIETKDNRVLLTPTTESQYYSFRKDFTLKSVETALGYSLAAQDMTLCVYPDSEDAHLQNFSEDFSGSINTLYEGFSKFDSTSVTECSNRIRQYLNLEYDATVSMEKDVVTITTNTYGGEQFFILKVLNQQIESMSDGEYEEIEEGVYLLRFTSSETKVYLKEAKNSLLEYFW